MEEAFKADGARVQSKVERKRAGRETLTGSSPVCMVCLKTKARKSEKLRYTNDEVEVVVARFMHKEKSKRSELVIADLWVRCVHA